MTGEFVDTNILVYALDPSEPAKHRIAGDLVTRLWDEGSGRLSAQVLVELFSVLTTKARPRIEPARAAGIVADYAVWPVHSPSVEEVLESIRLASRAKLSIWDAMIVRSALAAECAILWTEDLQHGRKFGSLEVRNPFRLRAVD